VEIKRGKIMKIGSKYTYLFFILPAILWVIAFTVYPFFFSMYISLTNMNLTRPGIYKLVGLDNYIELFKDDQFWLSFRHTAVFTISVITFQFLFGFFLALLLNRPMKGTSLVRTAVMLPWVLPPVALGLNWQWILRGGQLGLINAVLLQFFRIKPVDWLGFERALLSVISVTVWIGVPFSFMLELSGLQKIPNSLFEAANVDGASAIQKLFHIIIPMMKSTFMINLIMITISTIGYFDIIYALTDGGPNRATEVLPLLMYHRAFKFGNLGEGASVAMVMLLLSLICTFIYLLMFRRKEAEF